MNTPDRSELSIEEARVAGELSERERIIKLLEPHAEHDEFCTNGCYPEDCSAPSYQYAIDLIKGEQK